MLHVSLLFPMSFYTLKERLGFKKKPWHWERADSPFCSSLLHRGHFPKQLTYSFNFCFSAYLLLVFDFVGIFMARLLVFFLTRHHILFVFLLFWCTKLVVTVWFPELQHPSTHDAQFPPFPQLLGKLSVVLHLRYLGSFHILAIVWSTAMDTNMKIAFRWMVFVGIRIGIDMWYGSYFVLFCFLRNHTSP